MGARTAGVRRAAAVGRRVPARAGARPRSPVTHRCTTCNLQRDTWHAAYEQRTKCTATGTVLVCAHMRVCVRMGFGPCCARSYAARNVQTTPTLSRPSQRQTGNASPRMPPRKAHSHICTGTAWDCPATASGFPGYSPPPGCPCTCVEFRKCGATRASSRSRFSTRCLHASTRSAPGQTCGSPSALIRAAPERMRSERVQCSDPDPLQHRRASAWNRGAAADAAMHARRGMRVSVHA